MVNKSACKHCGSQNTKKNGYGKNGRKGQRYFCKDCSREQIDLSPNIVSNAKKKDQSLIEEDGNQATFISPSSKEVPDLDSLLKLFKVDRKIWKVDRWRINTWSTPMKQKNPKTGKVKVIKVPNYQAKANLIRKQPIKHDWFPIVGAKVKMKKKILAKRKSGDFKKAIIVPDMQVGYKRDFNSNTIDPLHDIRACNIVAQAIKDIEPDVVVMLGDNLDLPDWSTKFLHSPEFSYTTQPSLDYLASFIADTRPYVKDEYVYIAGNHEKRMNDNIITNSLHAYGVREANKPESKPVMSVPFLLGLDEMGVQYMDNYPRGEYWINDNLLCEHGYKVGAKSGQSVMKYLEDARCSVIFGHTHRMESANKTVYSRHKTVVYGAYNMGTLARTDGSVPSNARRENWQQGFGVVTYDDVHFHVNQINIFDGVAMFNNKVYKG